MVLTFLKLGGQPRVRLRRLRDFSQRRVVWHMVWCTTRLLRDNSRIWWLDRIISGQSQEAKSASWGPTARRLRDNLMVFRDGMQKIVCNCNFLTGRQLGDKMDCLGCWLMGFTATSFYQPESWEAISGHLTGQPRVHLGRRDSRLDYPHIFCGGIFETFDSLTLCFNLFFFFLC